TQEDARVLPRGELDVAAALDFAREPLVARDPATGEPLMNGDIVANRFATQLTAGYGILRPLEIGLALPIVLVQNGDPATLEPRRTLSTTALGDLRVFGKVRIADNESISFAAALDLTLPSGNANSFTGSPTATARPRLVLAVHPGDFAGSLNIG